METRGRKRTQRQGIPAHINQGQLPKRVHWDATGNGRWYLRYRDHSGTYRNKTIAGPTALLSDLHKAVEEWDGIERGTVRWLAGEYENSPDYKAVAVATRKKYDYARDIVCNYPTRTTRLLGDVPLVQWDAPTTQQLIDKLTHERGPTAARHVLRYLVLLFRWGSNRGHCALAPVLAIKSPKERKRRRMPTIETYNKLIKLAYECGQIPTKRPNSLPGYLWAAMEIVYLCRMRGAEVLLLTDASESPDGLQIIRTKGSRENIVRLTPRLRAAWESAKEYRRVVQAKLKTPMALDPGKRFVFINREGQPLKKSSLDDAFQALMKKAITNNIINESERFGLHDLKRRGTTDTPGNRADKQEASGHKSASMMEVYDLSVPIVDPSAE